MNINSIDMGLFYSMFGCCDLRTWTTYEYVFLHIHNLSCSLDHSQYIQDILVCIQRIHSSTTFDLCSTEIWERERERDLWGYCVLFFTLSFHFYVYGFHLHASLHYFLTKIFSFIRMIGVCVWVCVYPLKDRKCENILERCTTDWLSTVRPARVRSPLHLRSAIVKVAI